MRERLARRAEKDGFVPFDRYMDTVLYDPEVGYYESPRSPLGPSGDFYTAVHVSPLFARCLSERTRRAREQLGIGRPFRWVELGPGDGTLAATVAGCLAEGHAPGEVELVLVDRSARRREAALERVARAVAGTAVSVRAARSVAELGPFEGIVVANEVLDAQPVRRFRREASAWVELGVLLGAGGPTEAFRPAREPPPLLGEDLPEHADRIVECSPGAEALVREVADHLVRGVCLLIDYGAEEGELLAAHPHGTLAAVRGHRALDDPLAEPGGTDLSAFVNFSRVRQAARDAGLSEIAYSSQAEALGAWGFEKLFAAELATLRSGEAEVRLRLAAKSLLFGFGSFRVLELAAGGPAV